MSTRQILISIIIVVIIVVASVFSYLKIIDKESFQDKLNTSNLINVNVSNPIGMDSLQFETEFGYARSTQIVDIIAEGTGKLLNTPTRLANGVAFKKGQLLVRIDSEIKRHNLNASILDFKSSISSNLADIKIDYPSEFEIWEKYVTKIEVNKTLPELPKSTNTTFNSFIAQKGLAKQYNLIRSEEASIAKHNIYAPFDGTFTSVDQQEFSTVTVGKKIATIIRTDQLEVSIPISSELAGIAKKGTKISIKKGKNLTVDGKVSRISGFTSEESQTQQLYITITNAFNQKIYNGDYLSAKIPKSTNYSLNTIPQTAVINGTDVFIVNPIDSVLSVKHVITKDIIGSHSVVSGLKSTDLIINTPNSGLSKGMKVSYNKVQ